MSKNREMIARLGDCHIPYHDQRAIDVSLKFLNYMKPPIVVIDEITDFYAISRFNRDPRRRNHLQSDINRTIKFYSLLRDRLPNSRIIQIESNHDKRLRKYLQGNAPELNYLDCLKFENLLHLKDFNIEYKQSFVFRGILFKHGNIVAPESCYSAAAEFKKEGMTGVSGHTHRLGVWFKTVRGGKFCWIEGGCLCRTNNVEYIEGTANWQQGIAVMDFKKNTNHYVPHALPIINYEIMWGKESFRCD